ncbi:hypothetical protein CEP52_017093 [Fusarium oligoseptatum]|uniref:DUF7726 domain-containing protein n=1 Tax=Fusarium oligoseptatum TaxID=2604345 RepID=A0A428RWI7_9HYPO|nr:hypothetical protein CEP52_017093 [Fusarium oligoseptatum]
MATEAGWSWSPRRAMAQIHNNNLASDESSSSPVASADKENSTTAKGASSKPKPKPKSAATNSKKRKSDANEENLKEKLFPDDVEDIDDYDPRLDVITDTCNASRARKKVGEFQRTIGVSSKAYLSFMNRTGTWDGDNCDTYHKAHRFFKKRELQGLPLKAPRPKKPKTAASAKAAAEALDVSGVDELPGEETGSVPVFDTCEETRKKIRHVLARDGITQAAFIREINKSLPAGQSVSAANMRYFMGRKGPRDGNTNITFYAAYIFFEKKRIKAGKPKTDFREDMEAAWGPLGFDREHGANTHYIGSVDTVLAINRYGQVQSY